MEYKAFPISRNEIRMKARRIKEILNLQNDLYVDIVRLLENTLPELDPGFEFQIETEKELGNAHGLTLIDQKKIIIREDIYIGACENKGRDRFTMAHELGHYIFHNGNSLGLARVSDQESIITYCNPEWHADAFAGEFLMPAHLIGSMSVNEIASNCKVSIAAARCQMTKI